MVRQKMQLEIEKTALQSEPSDENNDKIAHIDSLLKDLNSKDLKQLTKYITQKYQSLETLSAYHKRQDTNSYAIDMFEMAICKCVSAYQKQKEKLNQNYAGKSVKNEQKM